MNRVLQRLEEGKLYYSISEVGRMTGLEAHVLRYWETEFPQMRPRKNRAGNRAYRPREIQYIHYIRHLLHEEKYTLQGAKKKLAEVSFEEVSGQTSLLRTPGGSQPQPACPEGGAAPAPEVVPPEPEATPALSARQRKELEAIRDELKGVLKLLAE